MKKIQDKWDLTKLESQEFVMKNVRTEASEDSTQKGQPSARVYKLESIDKKKVPLKQCISERQLEKRRRAGGASSGRSLFRIFQQSAYHEKLGRLRTEKGLSYNNVIFGGQPETNPDQSQEQFRDYDLIFDKKKSLSVTVKKRELYGSQFNSDR